MASAKSSRAVKASRKAGHKAGHGTFERKAAEKEHFGPSEAGVEYGRDYTKADRASFDRRVEAVFGRQLTKGELASLVGAPHDAKVTLQLGYGAENSFEVHVRSTEMHAIRDFRRNSKGEVVVHNAWFETFKTGTGLGTKVLGRQVEQAAKLGVKELQLTAGKGSGMVGYYTWARLGYNANIPSSVARSLPAGMKSAKTVNDLMQTSKGRDFWKTHGIQMDMKFDLSAGSLSRRTLAAYVKETGR